MWKMLKIEGVRLCGELLVEEPRAQGQISSAVKVGVVPSQSIKVGWYWQNPIVSALFAREPTPSVQMDGSLNDLHEGLLT